MTKAWSALTGSENDRRVLVVWAADCAERALPLFEAAHPDDHRPRNALAGTRAWVRGDIRIGEARKLAVAAHAAARAAQHPAARAAARACGHAAGVAHMAAHARHAAAYAAEAIRLVNQLDPLVAQADAAWQRASVPPQFRSFVYSDEP